MSKCVHLSGDAHAMAKAYCEKHGYRMSEWVAMLIDRAVEAAQGTSAGGSKEIVVESRAQVPKKRLKNLDNPKDTPEEAGAVYEQPPFWARS